MKSIILIFLGLLIILTNSALCELSVDKGPSWEHTFNSGWISKGDKFYKAGNYIDAIQRIPIYHA